MIASALIYRKGTWFENHFRKRIRRIENRIIKKMLLWIHEEQPSSLEAGHLFREIEENPEMNFFERFRC